jgi:hypothetical protein
MNTELTEQKAKLPLPLEFYLGIALGFLLASLMLNASCGWLAGLYPIPVLVMAFVGFIAGKIRQRLRTKTITSQRYFNFRFWIFLVVTLFCILGPYCVTKTYYWNQAANIPIPPGWTRTSMGTSVLGWDNGAGWGIQIEGYGEKEAFQFYRQYFEEKGWSDISSEWVREGNKYTYDEEFVFGKTGSYSQIWGSIPSMYYDERTRCNERYKPGQKRIILVFYTE